MVSIANAGGAAARIFAGYMADRYGELVVCLLPDLAPHTRIVHRSPHCDDPRYNYRCNYYLHMAIYHLQRRIYRTWHNLRVRYAFSLPLSSLTCL